MTIFSDRLRELRIKNQNTQKIVAESINISERSYISLESGQFKPSHDNIIKLANFFNVSSDYLLGISDDPTRR